MWIFYCFMSNRALACMTPIHGTPSVCTQAQQQPGTMHATPEWLPDLLKTVLLNTVSQPQHNTIHQQLAEIAATLKQQANGVGGWSNSAASLRGGQDQHIQWRPRVVVHHQRPSIQPTSSCAFATSCVHGVASGSHRYAAVDG